MNFENAAQSLAGGVAGVVTLNGTALTITGASNFDGRILPRIRPQEDARPQHRMLWSARRGSSAEARAFLQKTYSSVSVLRKATSARWSAALRCSPPSGCFARFGSSVGLRPTPVL